MTRFPNSLPPQSRSTGGFTLVELLVALAIVGTLLLAVTQLAGAVLNYSRHADARNRAAGDLSDALGYVSLNAQRAMNVLATGSIDITPNTGPSFTCALPTCLAITVPVVDRNDGSITNYQHWAYRWTTLDVLGNPALPEGWSGPNTPVLIEIRSGDLLAPGDDPYDGPPPLADFSEGSGNVPSLVIADLTRDDGGASFDPFAVDATGRLVTMQARHRGSGLLDDMFVPDDGPLTITVNRRP
ncbi:MAG: type II secretion system protein J [Phycisphaerales bacterium JB060]